MSDLKTVTVIEDISFDELDEIDNPRSEETEFDDVVEDAISRRGFLGGVLAFGTGAFLVGTAALKPTSATAASRFAFDAVAANGNDTITVPKGFSWHTVVKWGDPLWSNGPEFDHATRGTAESQALAFGDNNDGMSLFAHNGRSILAVNNEYTNRGIMYGNRDTKLPENEDDANKGKAAHGVSVFEVKRDGDKWAVVKDSSFNRRITAESPMELTGPAAGHDLLKTKADATGTKSLGTWNNCGNGRTPWAPTWPAKKTSTAISRRATKTWIFPKNSSAMASGTRTGATAGASMTNASTSRRNPTNRTAPVTL